MAESRRTESLVSSRDHSLRMFSFHEARGEEGILRALMMTSDRSGNSASKEGRLLKVGMLRASADGGGTGVEDGGGRTGAGA